jgi:hypothetical protein
MFWTDSIIYMVLSKDTKGIGAKYQIAGSESDPIHIHKSAYKDTTKKRVVFIRHGESDWNSIFNKGKNPMMIVRLIWAMITEWTMLFAIDSPFLDSPLNKEGIQQALELREFLFNKSDVSNNPEQKKSIKETLSSLRGENSNSILVSSTLRRAISTLTLAIWPRMEKSEEKIHLLSCAQEVSRNVDTCALSGLKEVPDLPFDRAAPYCANISPANFNPALNLGNKGLKSTGKLRIETFNKWLFDCSHDTIIVGGHSLWFKYYYNLCLPYSTEHTAKTNKMVNSGVIAFDIYKSNSQNKFCIDPASIDVVYGGFEKK